MTNSASTFFKVVQSEIDSGDQQKIAIVQCQLVLQPKPTSNKITSIQSWTDTFLIYEGPSKNTYASIYLTQYPNDAQGILKYMQTLRLGGKSQSFVNDRQIRLKMSKYTSTRWGLIDPELWLLYMSSQASMTTQPLSTLKCYNYNCRCSCAKYVCVYQHPCLYCH